MDKQLGWEIKHLASGSANFLTVMIRGNSWLSQQCANSKNGSNPGPGIEPPVDLLLARAL